MSSGAVSSLSFSFRPPEPLRPAAELLDEIRERGGRVYRMRSVRVCCLTDSVETAQWLLSLGGYANRPQNWQHLAGYPVGAYERARDGKVEWDIWIERIPVEGDLWEAAG